MQRIPETDHTPSGLLAGAEPFSIPGGRTGVLLIHGFTSTPYDVRACGEYLATLGFTVEAPLLAGHGTTPEDLAQTHLADWLKTIQESTERLRAQCDQVFALGISLSGNFLLSLAPLLPYDGLILIGTPLRFRYERAYRAAYRLLTALGREYQRKWYWDELDPAIRAVRPTYDRFPLVCAPDCMAAVEWSRRNLPNVRCPVLALQSTTDHAVDDRTLDEFASRLGAADLTIRRLPNRYHVLLIDHGADEVFAIVSEFIRERVSEPALAPAAVPGPLAQPAGSRS